MGDVPGTRTVGGTPLVHANAIWAGSGAHPPPCLCPTCHDRRMEKARMTTDEAHARRNDPETSHEAAASVMHLTTSRLNVLRAIVDHGPLADEHWMQKYRRDGLRVQSDAGLRSRRAELVEMGLVEHDSFVTIRNRRARTWRATAAGRSALFS